MLGSVLVGAILTFTLQDVPFDDGGSLSGSFVWNSVNDQITTWDFSTTAGTPKNHTRVFEALEYTAGNSSGGGDHIRFRVSVGLRNLQLAFGHSILERGLYRFEDSFIEPFSEDSFERQANVDASGRFAFYDPYRAFILPPTGGVVRFTSIATSVPEPNCFLMLLGALSVFYPLLRVSGGRISLKRNHITGDWGKRAGAVRS